METLTLMIKKSTIWMNTVAEVVLILMMMITVVDVVLRIFGTPIVGTYELVAMMGAMVVGFAIAKTSWDRGHVFVDILIENRSAAVKNAFFICYKNTRYNNIRPDFVEPGEKGDAPSQIGGSDYDTATASLPCSLCSGASVFLCNAFLSWATY